MRKIPTLFRRNMETDRLVRDEVTPGCEWVLAGEGVPTFKWDGSACMIREGKLYKRLEVKPGRTPPDTFIACQDADAVTGETPGWVPVDELAPENKWFVRALVNTQAKESVPDGTYEAVGPHFQGNPHGLLEDVLVSHAVEETRLTEYFHRDFDGLRHLCAQRNSNGHYFEGIVFHHPDGRMAKIKARDFVRDKRR